MEKYTILIIIFGILIFMLLALVFFVNRLLLKKEKVDHQFKSVIKYLDDRVNLLDRMNSFVEGNTENEDKYMKDISNASISLSRIENSKEENLKEIKKSSKLFQKFIKLKEIYPNIDSNKIYQLIVDEIILNEERIEYAIESYDKEAKKYNELKNTKFNSKISKIFKIKDYEYYHK